MLSKPTEKEEEAAVSRAAKMISMEAAVTSWQFLREFLFSSCFLIHPFLWQTEPKPTPNLAAANGGAESWTNRENKHVAPSLDSNAATAATLLMATFEGRRLRQPLPMEKQYVYKCETGGRIMKVGFGKLLPPARRSAPGSTSILMALCRRSAGQPQKHSVWLLCLFYEVRSCRRTQWWNTVGPVRVCVCFHPGKAEQYNRI